MVKKSSGKTRVLVAFGTRPEAIKLAPVIQALRKDKRFRSVAVLTGQHREMVDQVLQLFRIKPDYDLDLMRDNQDLVSLSHRLLVKLQKILRSFKPHWVVVQGDTTTAFVVAWAAFYEKIPVAHVEAGLRSNDPARPFPEEINRRLITQVAGIHFAPTVSARVNLLREGVPSKKVLVTGNTGIDSLLHCLNNGMPHRYPEFSFLRPGKKLVLVTCHRRESFGAPLLRICAALKELVRLRKDAHVVYPVHLNPEVRRVVMKELSGITGITLLEPLSYDRQVYLMSKAAVILTDSGGIQEEAPSLGVPVLVLREVTERPEGVRLGFARVVGLDKTKIVRETLKLLSRHGAPCKKAPNPYGDGKSSGRILNVLHRFSHLSHPPRSALGY